MAQDEKQLGMLLLANAWIVAAIICSANDLHWFTQSLMGAIFLIIWFIRE